MRTLGAVAAVYARRYWTMEIRTAHVTSFLGLTSLEWQ